MSRPKLFDRRVWKLLQAPVVLCVVLGAVPARSADEVERWVPSLGVGTFGGILVQEASGSAFSTVRPVRSGQVPGFGTNTIEQPAPALLTGTADLLTPFAGGAVEVMTPGIRLPARPRLFVHGGAWYAVGIEKSLASEGNLDQLEFPDTPSGRNPIGYDAGLVLGPGSELVAEVDDLVVTAGAGIAFTIDVLDRRFRIRPSFEYLREDVIITGAVQSVQGKRWIGPDGNVMAPGTCPAPWNGTSCDWRIINLTASKTKTFHGIGPGLELELDTGAQMGPFALSLYLSAQAFRVLEDRRITLSDSGEFPPNPNSPFDADSPPESARWTFEQEPWIYRGGVGLRLRWLPGEE